MPYPDLIQAPKALALLLSEQQRVCNGLILRLTEEQPERWSELKEQLEWYHILIENFLYRIALGGVGLLGCVMVAQLDPIKLPRVHPMLLGLDEDGTYNVMMHWFIYSTGLSLIVQVIAIVQPEVLGMINDFLGAPALVNCLDSLLAARTLAQTYGTTFKEEIFKTQQGLDQTLSSGVQAALIFNPERYLNLPFVMAQPKFFLAQAN